MYVARIGYIYVSSLHPVSVIGWGQLRKEISPPPPHSCMQKAGVQNAQTVERLFRCKGKESWNHTYCPYALVMWWGIGRLKICIRRITAVRKVQYSDLFFRLHGIRHTLNCTQCTLSISYLNTQNWKVLLIFTVKRFVSVAKNVFPHACIFSSLFLKES